MTANHASPLPPELRATPFTTATARASEVHRERLRRRDLDARVYGARAPAGTADTLIGRCRLFAARLDPATFFSHATAARLFGAPIPPWLERAPLLHVTVPSPRRAPHAEGLVGHSRLVHDGDVVEFAGLRVSSPQRVVFELAASLSLGDLVAVIDFFVHHRDSWCTVEHLSDRARVGDPLSRSRRAGRAIALADPRSESRPESLVRVALTIAGIPPTAVNLDVVAGGRRWRIDLAYEREKVAIEYQGGYHFDAEQRRRDMTRRSWLEAEGWTVIEFNSDDLADLGGIVTRVRAALTRR